MLKDKNIGAKISSVILAAALSASFLLLLLRSDVAVDYMKTGLKLCTNTVIPSLFPFMVVSSLLVSSGVGIRLCRPLSLPARLIFGVGEGGACTFLLGAICGFPVGTVVACSMYDKGLTSKKETERALTFCNNPGSAFVVSAVGASLFGSVRVGGILYACVIISAVITGVIMRLFYRMDGPTATTRSNLIRASIGGDSDGVSLFLDAIRSSALSMLTVCATVAFFSSIIGCVGATLSALGVKELPIAALFGLCEMSSGVSALSDLQSTLALPLCAAALGWSGLSVHCQIMAIAGDRGLSFKPYFTAKAMQGVVCGALAWACMKLFPQYCWVFADSAPIVGRDIKMQNSLFSLGVLLCTVTVSAAVGWWMRRSKKQGAKKI